MYGGWGNDVIDLRAETNIDGGLNDLPVPNLFCGTAPATNTRCGATPVYGTPAWDSLAYGGGGQDIMFAGTGGDRLIDWVGKHNSYYVPFSPYGMPTVSRTLQPFLQDFLYALSASDGADPSSALRYGGDPTRNGEPFGELGLVLQHDSAWHNQTGAPFNKGPWNLGGVPDDVAVNSPYEPLASPGTHPASAGSAMIALPSGGGAGMPSGTNPASAAAVPILVTGAPGATVNYTLTEGSSYTTSGTGTIDGAGRLYTTANVSSFPDGTIAMTATLTGGGAPTKTMTATLMKNSVAPPAPTVSAAAYANMFTHTGYSVTITGQVGDIATVVITDWPLRSPAW